MQVKPHGDLGGREGNLPLTVPGAMGLEIPGPHHRPERLAGQIELTGMWQSPKVSGCGSKVPKDAPRAPTSPGTTQERQQRREHLYDLWCHPTAMSSCWGSVAPTPPVL